VASNDCTPFQVRVFGSNGSKVLGKEFHFPIFELRGKASEVVEHPN
jgi:hypothetical protein